MSDENPGNEEQDLKDTFRQKYKGMPLLDLIAAMDKTKQFKEQEEQVLKEINAEFDVLRLELVPATMEAQGIERINVAGIGRVSLTGDMYVRIKQQEAFFKWLETNRLDDLIKETIASSTLKAFVKGRVKAGKELPTDLLNITPFTRASITKA